MKENLSHQRNQMLTIKQFAEKNPWPNETTMRNLFYKRRENGLEQAFVRIGRRIIVDEGKFFELIRAKKDKC